MKHRIRKDIATLTRFCPQITTMASTAGIPFRVYLLQEYGFNANSLVTKFLDCSQYGSSYFQANYNASPYEGVIQLNGANVPLRFASTAPVGRYPNLLPAVATVKTSDAVWIMASEGSDQTRGIESMLLALYRMENLNIPKSASAWSDEDWDLSFDLQLERKWAKFFEWEVLRHDKLDCASEFGDDWKGDTTPQRHFKRPVFIIVRGRTHNGKRHKAAKSPAWRDIAQVAAEYGIPPQHVITYSERASGDQELVDRMSDVVSRWGRPEAMRKYLEQCQQTATSSQQSEKKEPSPAGEGTKKLWPSSWRTMRQTLTSLLF